MPVTPSMLQEKKENDCVAITAERKYYHTGQTFVKRSLRPCEWQTSPSKGTLHVPRQGRERILNEAAAIEFITKSTNLPVPKLFCSFEDDQAVYLIMEYIDGVSMDQLTEHQQRIVRQELAQHLTTLHRVRSSQIGGPSGFVRNQALY